MFVIESKIMHGDGVGMGTGLIGDRAFVVAGPRAWNSLPSDIQTYTPSFDNFKKHLKSYLFQQSFYSL